MEIICPNCGKAISSANINVQTDMAQCGGCGSIEKLSNLVAPTNQVVNSQPPNGSRIVLDKKFDGSIELILPKQAFKAVDLIPFLFSILWITFVFFWTHAALMGGGFFALFSIPFWIIGITMLGNMINTIGESQVIKVTKESLSVFKNRAIFSKKYAYSKADIQDIRICTIYKRSGKRGGYETNYPAVFSGEGKQTFFESCNEVEHEWVVGYLKKFMGK
jgi:eukaryotic-like serine/threonine-protein kinase